MKVSAFSKRLRRASVRHPSTTWFGTIKPLSRCLRWTALNRIKFSQAKFSGNLMVPPTKNLNVSSKSFTILNTVITRCSNPISKCFSKSFWRFQMTLTLSSHTCQKVKIPTIFLMLSQSTSWSCQGKNNFSQWLWPTWPHFRIYAFHASKRTTRPLWPMHYRMRGWRHWTQS